MMLPQCCLPGSCLALWQEPLHGCYKGMTLCAVQDGCLLPRLPGVPVPFAFDLEAKSSNHQLMVSV